jgi:hypothetical protein
MTGFTAGRVSIVRVGLVLAALGLVCGSAAGAARAQVKLPEIRLSPQNRVPACVTPERLMAFLKTRNGNLNPRFRDIASYYKRHGEAWGVRWDYAFFQMAIETNFLTYRAPSGRMGDVDPKQNNFAGIGTTGGGVPGDSFPDVSTGVLGQIQHLVVYSGEMIPNPVAPRTQLKQEHILVKSRELNRSVRFSDLAGRWAADRKYGGSIEWVAQQYRSAYCKGAPLMVAEALPAAQGSEVLPWQQKRASAASTPPAKATSSPVRTVWSRDQQAAAAAPKAKARAIEARTAEVKTAAPNGTKKAAKAATVAPVAPTTQPQAPAPADEVAGLLQRDDVAAAQPTAEPDPESSFALFTPPAALAAATLRPASQDVPAAPRAEARVAPIRIEPEPAGAPAPEASPSPPAASATEAAPVSVLPPADPAPEAVAVAEAPAKSEAPGQLASLFGGASGQASKPAFDPPSGLGVKPSRCVVETARYGGDTTVLVKSPNGSKVHFIALSVIDGFEDSMTKSFLSSRAEGGEVLGTFPSRDAALAQARTLCPG